MTSSEVRKKYLKFFQEKGHKIVPSASLVPENDPTTLFTSAGMQPMVPYLLGEEHPEGKRIVDSQKVFRSQDIEEVGDNRHDTLFEMLGNWSFGDYWKKEQLNWIFELLFDVLGLDIENFYVSVFMGDPANNLPKDEETVEIWKKLFLTKNITATTVELGSLEEAAETDFDHARISYYKAVKNWWSRSGEPDQMPAGEPGGPSSEMFYELKEVPHDPNYGKYCHPNCDCGRFVEIGNSVFMQYQKQPDGSLKELPNKNVDFGGGLERLLMALNNQPDIFKNDSHRTIIEKACEYLGIGYEDNSKTTENLRIIADHIKAATFLIKDGILPSNKLQGYVLRRLLRRAAVKVNQLKENSMDVLPKLVDPVLDIYKDTDYFQDGDWNMIRPIIEDEISKFQKTLKQGLKEFNKAPPITMDSPHVGMDQIDTSKDGGQFYLDPVLAFRLYETYGFPLEVTIEIANEQKIIIPNTIFELFENEKNKHAELSRTTSAGVFKGGLADQTEQTTKLHTTTHLLQAASKQVLGKDVGQRGSHITAERLRWDFNYNQKLTDEQIKQIEDLVNENIKKDLKVWFDIENREEAIKKGATTNQGENYPDKVKVYKIGGQNVIASEAKQSRGLNSGIASSATPSRNDGLFSQELCGGPHVEHTGTLGKFKITKEEGVSSGVRRIYATVDS